MARPAKTFAVLTNEKKSHRTKAELETRRRAEGELATGAAFRMKPEVAANPAARKEFARLKKLFRAIGKDDALVEGVVNQHCMLHAECCAIGGRMAAIDRDLEELEARRASEEIEFEPYMRLRAKLLELSDSLDRQAQQKRRMLLDIAKESLMTPASMLRSIPKKPSDEADDDPMARFMQRRGAV